MASCYDCVHINVCKAYEPEDADCICNQFKNKADVVEVKHGEWLDNIVEGTTVAGIDFKGVVGYKCSLCGREERKKEPYCNCGAKMGGQ